MRQVVITGCGVVSAFGHGRQTFTEALMAGRSAVSELSRFDARAYRSSLAAQVEEDYGGARIEGYLAAAAREALADAGLTAHGTLPGRTAVFQATAHGALDRWEQGIEPCAALPAQLGASLWPSLIADAPVTTVTTACVASAWGAGLALQAIRRGECDIAVVAGAEPLSKFLFGLFSSLRSLSPTGCRPFDRRSNGMVLGEGAAVLVLEAADTAQRRGASIRAELAGFGFAADAHHMIAPEPGGRGSAAALQRALADAGVETPDYINLHGTGTPSNDRMEVSALRKVLGPALGKVSLGASKSMTGHTSGASGVMELAVCLGVLEHDIIPPTHGLEEPDHEFRGCDFVFGAARERRCNTVASLNNAFGGNNTALVLRRAS